LSARSQSLRALLEIPALAEKHSRDLVPLFLSLESTEDSSIKWSRTDRLPILTLFTKFTNPRALYQASQVRTTLYSLLQNGDAKIQTLALDGILTWKDIELVTYRENLHNLLDEKKFREELTSLLNVDENDSPIQEEHRPGLMQVLMRILFGNTLVRQGAGEGKRSAILSVLANLRDSEKRIFLDIALLPFEPTHGAIQRDEADYQLFDNKLTQSVDDRKMMGFIIMVQHLIKALGARISPFLHELVEALVVCMWKSKLPSNVDCDLAEEDDMESKINTADTKSARSLRKSSMKTLTMLIDICPDFEWEGYVLLIYRTFVSSTLSKLADENIQSPSAKLQFFEAISRHPRTVTLLSFCGNVVIANIVRCLETPTADLSIFDSVFRMFSSIYKFSEEPDLGETLTNDIILPHLTNILEHITTLLTKDEFQHVVSNKDTLDLITDVLRFSAPFVRTSEHAEHLIEPLISLLGKPSKIVNDKTKVGILESVLNLLPQCSDFSPESATFETRLVALSRLFQVLNSRHARVFLCQTMDLFEAVDPSLTGVGNLVTDLNAFDSRRIDVPDFDRRLTAFGKVNEKLYSTLTSRAWTPIVYNLLYYLQDVEEMSLRTGAAFGLQRFFNVARDHGLSPEYTSLLSTAIFPSVKKGSKHSNEIIRKEFSGVLDSLVKSCGEWPPISDLKVLLFEGDEEANFFNNIYHIQQHRQLRAITRLSKAADDGELKPGNIEAIFIPMLEKFAFTVTEEGHNVAAEAVRGIGALSGTLGWKSYRQLVKRYLSMLKVGDEKERPVVRTICGVVERVRKVADARIQRMAVSNGTADGEDKDEEPQNKDDFLAHTVVNQFYPPMLQYLHRHEDHTLALRVPVAISLVKILKFLPEKHMSSKLPAVLTDVCHILKSRSQEARDICRKTLNEIMTLLGSSFFSFVLKELKAALSRGYQLHVLGYTVHAILTHLSADYGQLDGYVKDTVDVLVDDIFGATGAEKDSEGYTTSMKEVKASKSYDSFEILASITSSQKLGMFLSPLKALLYDLSSAKELRKMNEILRRTELGILRSKGADPSETLNVCLTLFKGVQAEIIRVDQPKGDVATNQFIVDLKFRRKREINYFKANAPILLRFALNTTAMLLKKYEYLVNEEKVSDLVPVLGDCLVSDVDELRIPALRLLGRMISVPIPTIEDGIDVFVDRAVQFIKDSPLTKAELCQASIKFLSLLIRDRKTFTPRENIIIYLFERIRPDLEEPDRQGVSFSFIRAVLSRKIIITEVYDMMSAIAIIMITNQSRSVRDTTRALYLQFLMDYPQGRDRLKKQVSFLVQNLQYEHDTGRQSVMEVLHQIISKFGDELLQPILLDLFVGLLLPLVNDVNPTSREMASRLIQNILENADEERLRAIRTMLRTWAKQSDKPALLKASLHVYSILLEHGTSGEDDSSLCVDCVGDLISQSQQADLKDLSWDVMEQAFELLVRLVKVAPKLVFSEEKEGLWVAIRQLLLSESIQVRLIGARLVGLLFSRAESLPDGRLQVESLQLRVPNLTALTRQFLEQIKSPESTVEIGVQGVKNLVFVGRHFYRTNCLLPAKTRGTDDTEPAEAKSCLDWLISRVAAEIRFERAVAEVYISRSKLTSSMLVVHASCSLSVWWPSRALWRRTTY
jgi:U3 small nucleolar RNA-associated protein 20